MNFALEPVHYIFFLVLIKWALAMIVAALLAYFGYFADRLFSSVKTLNTRLFLVLILSLALLVGVVLRFTANYHALDISIIGLYITAVITGFIPAFFGALCLSLVLFAFSGDYYTVIFYFVSVLAGSFFYSSSLFENKKMVYMASLGMLPVTILMAIANRYTGVTYLFSLSNGTLEGDIIAASSEFIGVLLMFFVWNHHITTLKLQEKSSNLNKAKLAILSSKINPHFLFNTLNTIASATRIDPDIARQTVFRLSEILRYILKTENEFRPLKDEVDFIENYLSIEMLRFGESRLKVDIEISDDVRETKIPTMLIQPVVENSIKHGISSLTEKRGQIKLKVIKEISDKTVLLKISVHDNGIGMELDEEQIFNKGIGLSNVRDRLKLLYSDKARLVFASSPGSGTTISIFIPVG